MSLTEKQIEWAKANISASDSVDRETAQRILTQEGIELRKWVNVYEITRHYGGPEEGGWWYNWYEPIRCVSTIPENAEILRELLKREYADQEHGDIYSVLGGVAIEVYIEDRRAESQTTTRPHYE